MDILSKHTPSTLTRLGAPKRRPHPLDLALGHADFVRLDPFACFAEGEDDPPDGGKTFTQAELDKIIADRLRKRDRELAKVRESLEAEQATRSSLEERIAELEAGANKGKGGEGDGEGDGEDVAKLKREVKSLAAQLEQATKTNAELEEAATASASRYRDFRIRQTATEALAKAGVLNSALEDAVEMFARSAELETGEDGDRLTFTVGDVPYDDPAEAAKKYLAAKPHFVKAGHGSGSSPSRGGGPTPESFDVEKDSPASLIGEGLKQPVAPPK